MANPKMPANEHEKERIRAEIDDQVAEFLNRGGKIDIVNNERQQRDSVGSVWHQQDELSKLIP